jgi:hypothetical protein
MTKNLHVVINHKGQITLFRNPDPSMIEVFETVLVDDMKYTATNYGPLCRGVMSAVVYVSCSARAVLALNRFVEWTGGRRPGFLWCVLDWDGTPIATFLNRNKANTYARLDEIVVAVPVNPKDRA